MPELFATFGAIAAGASCGVAVYAMTPHRVGIDAAIWLARRRGPAGQRPGPWSRALEIAGTRDRVLNIVEQAGWNETPERLTAFAIALSGSIAVMGAAGSAAMHVGNAVAAGIAGFAIGLAVCSLSLGSAVGARRRRLAAELVPLLELFALELSGGGSPLAALGSITTQVRGELASDLRRMMIAAQVAGSVPFESRLMQYSDCLNVPALASLATILSASREYGTGVGHGVRALATDLRHAQRRELIAHSRRALNHVLIPAAIGVLLPFLAVVMFPAVTALQSNLH
jgi:pilus assembly protein TadC